MTQAHHRKSGDEWVTTLPYPKTRRNQLLVLRAMAEGTPLVAGLLGDKRIHSATLATLTNQWLIEVSPLNRAYRLTPEGMRVLARYHAEVK